jgi:hypothetical protein
VSDKKLFGLVSKSKHAGALEERSGSHIDTAKTGQISQESAAILEAYDRLKQRSGPVARELTIAEKRLHAGQPKTQVYAEARKRIIEELTRVLKGGKGAFAS